MMSGLRRKLTMDEVRADWFADTLRLKDIEIVVSPCELASKFGKEIKRLSPAKCCLIFFLHQWPRQLFIPEGILRFNV